MDPKIISAIILVSNERAKKEQEMIDKGNKNSNREEIDLTKNAIPPELGEKEYEDLEIRNKNFYKWVEEDFGDMEKFKEDFYRRKHETYKEINPFDYADEKFEDENLEDE